MERPAAMEAQIEVPIDMRRRRHLYARATVLTLAACVAMVLTGCSTDGTTTGPIAGGPDTGVYVIQNTPATSSTSASGSVLEFSTAASGSATPTSTLIGSPAGSLAFLAADGMGNIYTSAQTTTGSPATTTSSINEYAVGSIDSAPATRSIPFNSTTGLTSISSLSVDAAGDIFASNTSGSVSKFSATATGSVAPSSTVSILSAVGPQATAVDASGNLYVAAVSPATNTSIAPIVVFAPGSTTPSRSIGGALTTMVEGSPKALATDIAGNLYVTNVISGVSSILIFGPDASGNTPPLRAISGSNTLLGCAGGIALDTEGYLYVVSVATCGSTANPTVLKFSTTGDGNIAPSASFTANTWTNADAALSIAIH